MKPYEPKNLPLENLNWVSFVEKIARANYTIAVFEGILKAVVNPSILLSPLNRKEAILSSKIEGTQATLQEVLEFEADPDNNSGKFEDIQEVLNYRKTLYEAENLLKKKPMNINDIKSLHFILLDSVRGQGMAKGQFRNDQNWIGKPGSKIDDAYFIPPKYSSIQNYMNNWEKYWHSDEKDKIVQMAILHAQFEIIHPFKDGNGRLGRIFIPLFLFEKKLLSSPVFYMSEYLEENREEYYFKLRNISDHDDWNGWIDFFLNGFINQAEKNSKRAEKILSLYEKMKRDIHSLHTSFALPALDTLFTMPVFNTNGFIRYSGIPKASALRLINQLEELNIIINNKKGRGRHPGIFSFPELIKITEE